MEKQSAGVAKYRQISIWLQKRLREGAYPLDVPLPSEEALMRRFGVSRITVVKAMEELRRKGLIWRRRGAGTFATRTACAESGHLGLIMPSMSLGEIFPLICTSLARYAQRDGFSFVLGDVASPTPEQRAHEACEVARLFVRQRVAGVIFQPLAFIKSPSRVTCEIISVFNRAGIPVVLIDRDVERSEGVYRHDFVGIDNFSAGRELGLHMKRQGARRIRFLLCPNGPAVIRYRIAGVLSVLEGVRPTEAVLTARPDDVAYFAPLFKRRTRPDAIICESDFVAVHFRNTLAQLGISVPDEVMLAGFDDVRNAVNAVPPLTSVRQPCDDIARIAYRSLRERMREPSLPSRRILLNAPLFARESTRAGTVSKVDMSFRAGGAEKAYNVKR